MSGSYEPGSVPDSARRFEQAMKLAEFWWNRYTARLQYEWKVSLGVWGLLAAGATFLLDKNIPHLCWIAAAIVGGHAFWLAGVWTANERDKIQSTHWAGQASVVLNKPGHTPSLPAKATLFCWRSFGFLWNWSMIFQLGTTVILVVIDYILAGSKIPPVIYS